jgi:restriction system protein
LPESVLAEVNKNGGSRFENQVAWARFYLTKADLIDSSKFGVWTLTEAGRKSHLSHVDAVNLHKRIHEEIRAERADDAPSSSDDQEPEALEDTAFNHRERVLEILRKLSPSGFEKFCQRLLRESGFEEVDVTGRSGDGGIDGHGVLRLNPLVSMKILFQCKRYKESIGSPQIRDFQAAVMGRADRGLFLATSTFTPDARREAARDGVVRIELIDVNQIIDLIERAELGVRRLSAFEVDDTFFKQFS